jgi:acetyltransferase-like isoleucine patch superfamily enzyme
MSNQAHNSFEDPLSWLPRMATKLYTLWLSWTYPFASLGNNFSAHYSCDLRRPTAPRIKIGNSVQLERDVWLNISDFPANDEPAIILEDGCRIGRNSMLSAKNRIYIGQNTILGSCILVMDHNHAYEDVAVPIRCQGITMGGTIRIEEGCSIGFGAIILCNQGELVIGKNSVVGANSVVSRSIPANSVVAGYPAKLVKRSDPSSRECVLESGGLAGQS